MAKADREKNLSRSLRVDDRAKFDAEKLTLSDIAFSSEEPVQRWGENEVLGHSKGEYDFDRLNNDHPFLLGHNEHDPKSQIGVITKAWVEDGKGRCDIRFSDSPEAKQIFRDMQTGIRKLISVGYDRTGIVESKKASDGMMTTRYRWMPTHVASVPVPADTTVGVGRSKKRLCPDCDGDGDCDECDGSGMDGDEKCSHCSGSGHCRDCGGTGYIVTKKSKTVDSPETTKVKQQEFMAETTTVTPPVVIDESKVRKDALAAERVRTSEISKIADALVKDHGKRDGGQMAEKIRSMANEALAGEETVDGFKLRCMTGVLAAKPAEPTLIENCTDEIGRNEYSILRGIQSCIKRDSHVPDGREGEVHQECVRRAKNAGEEVRDAGFQVPANAPMRVTRASLPNKLTRDMTAGVFAQGGAFVPTILQLPIIEILRNMEILDKLGMQTMAGLQGNIVIPRQEAAATAYSVAETAALTVANQILGQISLNPHRVGVQQVYSRLFLIQSAPDAEEFMRSDMLAVLALKWDILGLNGSGAASEPLGVMNTPGIGSITFGATPTYAKIVSMETTVRAANVRTANAGPLSYVTTPTSKGTLKITPATLTGSTVVSGTSNALWTGNEDEGRMNGYAAWDTNQVPGNRVLLGAFRQLIRGMWGGLSVIVDPYTKAGNDEYVITMNSYGDFALRHPQAFVVSSDAGNQ